MSKFNSKKKYKDTQTSGGGGSIRRMKLVVGKNIVRIVEDNFEDAWVHHFEDAEGKNKRAVCLGKGKCPLCEKKKATHRFYFNVIDRKEQKESGETTIKLLECGKMIYEQIRDLALDDEYGDPTQYNLKIDRKGDGLKTKYAVRASAKKYDLTKEEKEVISNETENGGAYDLSYFVSKQTKGEILSMIGEEVDSEEDGEEDEDNQENLKPKKKSKASRDIAPKNAQVEDEVEDEVEDKEELDLDEELESLEDSDDDDVDDEKPEPKKKCKKKKKLVAKEEDEEEDDEEEDW